MLWLFFPLNPTNFSNYKTGISLFKHLQMSIRVACLKVKQMLDPEKKYSCRIVLCLLHYRDRNKILVCTTSHNSNMNDVAA